MQLQLFGQGFLGMGWLWWVGLIVLFALIVVFILLRKAQDNDE